MARKTTVTQAKFEDVIGDLIFFKELVVPLSIELGRTTVTIRDLLDFESGSIIELSKSAGETLDVYANNYLIMKAEVTVIEDSFGLRVTEITNPWKRI
ncbi:Flagellar motor switch protein FliN [Sulfidibacter corallicola]|uniref:Flagellar motor switch protein FliN n=1 Tax=Sulfidibacter corallicola TaxID=2818388 RepID=A0A8A4TSE2_SULCO|nr:flagellar motor switch protein FliN [Sulfidibacter corallicola]QTD52433.1 flagellar motor switch protein FliN [Sulfidibacter corallicola]